MTDHHPADQPGTTDPARAAAPPDAHAGALSGAVSGVPSPAAAPRPVPREVLRARAYLLRVSEPQRTAAAVLRLVDQLGPVETAARVRSGTLPGVVRDLADRRALGELLRGGRGQDRADADVDADFDAAAAVGARLLVPEDPDWPTHAFRAFGSGPAARLAAPLALWVRGGGSPTLLSAAAVSVIGSRAASHYSCLVATGIGSTMAYAGITTVTSGAFGVAAAAHGGALAAGGPTVAVLACGIDRAYPVAHVSLFDRLAESGLLVSEYPPGAVPTRHRFIARARVVAALGDGCVVVEAGARSSSRATAADAAALGRHVMAVPGRGTSATSAGCRELIRGGAERLTSSQQLVDHVRSATRDTQPG